MNSLGETFKRRGVKEQLEPLLDHINVSWGRYVHDKDNVTQELAKNKLVIIPFSEKFMRMPYEWQAHRATDLLHRLDTSKQVMIIPLGSKLFRKSPSKSTLKKGNLLPVRYHSNNPLDLKSAFTQQIKTVSQDQFFYGWDFEGVNYSTQEFRTVLLYDHIRAQLALQTMKQQGIILRAFCDYMPEKGIIVVRNMPSLQDDKVYDDFVIEGVVTLDKVSAHPAKTFDFASTHSCYKTTYAKIKFGRDYRSISGKVLSGARQGRESSIDHHVILAMHLAQEVLQKENVHLYNPFVKANAQTLTFFDKLHKHVLLDYQEGNVQKRGPLDIAHIENMLWNYVAYENAKIAKKENT